MTFEQLSDSKLKKNDFLWRYLDFHKLLYLFLDKKLFFPRLDLFQDPFEGVTTKLIKQRFLAKSIPDAKNLNPTLPNEIKESLLKQKESVDKQYEKESLLKQKTQFVNCWFYENRESMAMWNVYSNSDSVAIKLDGSQLVEYLKRIIELQPRELPKNKFICGAVKYFEINPVNLTKTISGLKYSAFKKDSAFDYEKEYRLLIVTPTSSADNNPSYLSIDLTNTFFEMLEVVCHPQMEDWKVENIKKLCGQFNVQKVRTSSIETR
jgi:hypothetical protein